MLINQLRGLQRYLLSMTSVSYRPNIPSLSRTLLIGVLLTTCACSHAPLETLTVPLDLQKPDSTPALPLPQAIQTLPVQWIVNPNPPQYCLTPQGYENLSLVQADTLRWIKEAMWQLNYYRSK